VIVSRLLLTALNTPGAFLTVALLSYAMLAFGVCWALDLPVNEKGLRFREWWRRRPRWRE